MIKKSLLSILFLVSFGVLADAQNTKPPLDFTVYDGWKSLSSQQISADGNWISYETNPSVGDGNLYFLNRDDIDKKQIVPRGSAAKISINNDFFAFRIKPFSDTVRQAKLDKVKADKMPKDSLVVFLPESGKTFSWGELKSFKLPETGSSLMAFMLEEADSSKAEKEDENTESSNGEKQTEEKKSEAKKPAKKPAKKEYKGSKLRIFYPMSEVEKTFEYVTDYQFSKKSDKLVITSIEEDSLITSRIWLYKSSEQQSDLIWEREGVTKKVSFNEDLSRIAFLHSTDTVKNKVYSLYYWDEKMKSPEILMDSLTSGLPEGYVVSENGAIRFSDDGKYLFIGTAPRPENTPEGKDSLLADEKVQVDVWHWQDPVLQSMQLKRINSERNKSYQGVIHLKKKTFMQLGSEEGVSSYRFPEAGNTHLGLGFETNPYLLSNEINFESFKDVLLIDIQKGESQVLFEGIEFNPSISPNGLYLYWWEPKDSNYYVYDIRNAETRNLTAGLPVSFASDTYDNPGSTPSYGSMGWARNDQFLYLYDKYDIWKFDPAGKVPPVNVTQSAGRESDVRFRYARLDPNEKFLDEEAPYLFKSFNYENKQAGYYLMTLKSGEPKVLMEGDFSLPLLAKARKADQLIWTKGTVSDYPELYTSRLDFTEQKVLTNTNPQQAEYNWLTVELVEWLDYDGERHQGLLYKPENFDPNKKYPMMVYFYERHSDGMHNHITPRASYSTINTAFYASNGYLVFMPDIHFKIGYPGKSSFNSIVSGVMSLGKEKPYINMKKLGLQGQSWGGYITAYLITQTDLFAAASPGAPVSNMTSAYGGIRTGSGMCRQVQYEKGQSRIGGTLWDKPILFYENSPLFYAHQVNTPCLIRHSDNDEAVPFAQGVEFFVALRRLGKPAWLINYNDGPHNLTNKLSDRKDLSVRMKQFFDHYLKDEPAPDWLTGGVKAIDKKKNETYYMQFAK